jgi:hypothetical protein
VVNDADGHKRQYELAEFMTTYSTPRNPPKTANVGFGRALAMPTWTPRCLSPRQLRSKSHTQRSNNQISCPFRSTILRRLFTFTSCIIFISFSRSPSMYPFICDFFCHFTPTPDLIDLRHLKYNTTQSRKQTIALELPLIWAPELVIAS